MDWPYQDFTQGLSREQPSAGAPSYGQCQGGDDCAHYGQVLSDIRGQAVYQSGPALQASKMCSTTLAPLVPERIGQHRNIILAD